MNDSSLFSSDQLRLLKFMDVDTFFCLFVQSVVLWLLNQSQSDCDLFHHRFRHHEFVGLLQTLLLWCFHYCDYLMALSEVK